MLLDQVNTEYHGMGTSYYTEQIEAMSSFDRSHVLLSYSSTLRTQLVKTFPLLTNKIHQFANIGNNSKKAFQATRIRAVIVPANHPDYLITYPR